MLKIKKEIIPILLNNCLPQITNTEIQYVYSAKLQTDFSFFILNELDALELWLSFMKSTTMYKRNSSVVITSVVIWQCLRSQIFWHPV